MFGKVDREIKSRQLKLQQIQDSIHTVEDVRQEKELRLELEYLMDKEEIIWAQKARSNWITQGDRNSKYFQTLVKQRRARNRILQLRKADGNLTEDLSEIESMFLDHFKDQFKENDTKSLPQLMEELASLPIPKIDHHQKEELERPMTNAKIEWVVQQLGLHKALGPNGIPAFFHQYFWSIVRQDIISSTHAFFH